MQQQQHRSPARVSASFNYGSGGSFLQPMAGMSMMMQGSGGGGGGGGSPILNPRTSPSTGSQRNSGASIGGGGGAGMRRASRNMLGIVAMPPGDHEMVFEEPPATEMEALLAEV